MVYTLYMSRYKMKKDYQWSPEMAYLLGLFASDGCLVNNGRHLNIVSIDYEIMEYCQSILGKRSKIRIKYGQFNTPAYVWQFSDVSLYDFLMRAGLTSAKSKTIGPLLLPTIYYRDFLRGYFDGDGTVYGYWDKRWSNSLAYCSGYVSASHRFLEWIQLLNFKYAGVSRGSIRKGNRVEVLLYAKADSQKLYQFMYYEGSVPRLTRKFSKFTEFIKLDPYAIITPDARVL